MTLLGLAGHDVGRTNGLFKLVDSEKAVNEQDLFDAEVARMGAQPKG